MAEPRRPIRVLFVCMGNICRSPTGEALFRDYVAKQGAADRFDIDSAGTTGYHVGEPPDSRMAAAARTRGYALGGAARQVSRHDIEEYDLVIAMDSSNLRDLHRLDKGGRHEGKLHLMLDFHPARKGADVPDPYYGGEKGFHEVIDLIEQACPSLYKHAVEKIAT